MDDAEEQNKELIMSQLNVRLDLEYFSKWWSMLQQQLLPNRKSKVDPAKADQTKIDNNK